MAARETEVAFTNGDVSLAGTLARSAGREPDAVVVFAHGSGPLDRNANAPGMALNIFSALAESLAAQGIASLRYDKRGIGASTGRFEVAREADLIADLEAAAGYAVSQVDRPLILCGHSEGTSLAAALAPRIDVQGLVLLCPYLASGRDVLLRQAADMDATLRSSPGLSGWLRRRAADLSGWPSQRQKALLQRLDASSAPTLRIGGQDVPAAWLRDFARSDQRARHSGHALPCLILAAEHDAQCPPEDAEAIAALGPHRSFAVLPGLSHILRKTDARDLADYPRQIKEPLDPSVAAVVGLWLQERFGRDVPRD